MCYCIYFGLGNWRRQQKPLLYIREGRLCPGQQNLIFFGQANHDSVSGTPNEWHFVLKIGKSKKHVHVIFLND